MPAPHLPSDDHSGAAPGPTFRSLGVAAEIAEALEQAGMPTAFAIQELTLPIALRGDDLIGQARTGMGKTLGFGVPLLDRIFDDAGITELDGSVRGLVVVPTRELCLQVAEDLTLAAANLVIPSTKHRVTVTPIYGGVGFNQQIRALSRGTDVVVGTPGRLLDLHRRGELELSGVEVLVLDEADEMLDQGFLDDIRQIMSLTSTDRQTMLFSATMPGPILSLSRQFMKQPVMIQADSTAAADTHERVTQIAFQSHKLDRMSTLSRILQSPGRGRTIVFTPTKRQAAMVAEDLAAWGFRVGAVHGDMRQADREQSLQLFRDGAVDVMVATDVAARGIDVTDVTHVVNYQVPEDERTYVHRIGRTARAGKDGTAITLVGWDEVPRWDHISEALGLGLENPPQWFSQSPELLEVLGLPTDEELGDRVGPNRRVAGSAAATAPARRSRGGRGERGQRAGSRGQGGRGRGHETRGRAQSAYGRGRGGRPRGGNGGAQH
ncbi:DEAD/DEAH box helicase [Corynebacterium sp. UMB9976]|uniref:DEAD/DEAH box helicase n=1 Tax=Corynebacterium sp. UMB9976 TaxID=3046354 RepID=UPI002550775A|nr:DEAD/DEAH box helicase [Corynebacterium sp. UMB9976]MDK6301525.1 DEAD/DEAH box helicase [Corynebacterium sp. UMB9976]